MKIVTKTRIVWVAIIALLAAYPVTQYVERAQQVAQIEADKAEFDRICRDVAGYKIYKTVADVEGIQLLKIRQKVKWDDPMAPGAAFAHELWDDEYIAGFIAFEFSTVKYRPLDHQYRGAFSPKEVLQQGIENSPGYRYVDIYENGMRYRVTGSDKVTGKKDMDAPGIKLEASRDPDYDYNIYRWSLDRVQTESPPPRYAVTFEDYVIPEERRHGLASSKVKVIDTQTNEVLGEMLRYAWTPGVISAANPTPWLAAYACPGNPSDGGHNTRAFVDQVLFPVGSIHR